MGSKKKKRLEKIEQEIISLKIDALRRRREIAAIEEELKHYRLKAKWPGGYHPSDADWIITKYKRDLDDYRIDDIKHTFDTRKEDKQ